MGGYVVGRKKGPSSSFVHSEKGWKGTWGARVPERVKHFIWRIKHGSIASKVNLAIKHIAIKHIARDTLCPICKLEEETTEHVFPLCPWTSPFWFGLQVCSVPTSLSVSSMVIWLESVIEQENLAKDQHTITLTTVFYDLWFIWKARNTMVFEGKNPNPFQTLILVNNAKNEFLAIRASPIPKP